MYCTICHNETNNRTHTFREMMFGTREEFDYLECGACKTIQIITVPSDMDRHYPKEYYSLTHSPQDTYAHPMKALLERARIRYAVFGTGLIGKLMYTRYPDTAPVSLSRISGLTKSSRILDIGCGSGRLLYALKEIGFHALSGTDPYLPAPIAYDNGLTIENKPVQELNGPFDIIMLHHVFEHIADPVALLTEIRKKLTDTGTIIIRIPVADCEAWHRYGKDWVQLDPPRHFFLHTPMSMDMLAEQTGLVVDEIVFDSRDFQFWGSEQYIQDIPLMDEQSLAKHPRSTLFSKEQRKQWKEEAIDLNSRAQGDQACFYLRKK